MSLEPDPIASRMAAYAERAAFLTAVYGDLDRVPLELSLFERLPRILPPPVAIIPDDILEPPDDRCTHVHSYTGVRCDRRASVLGDLCPGHLWRHRNGKDMDAAWMQPRRRRRTAGERDDPCRRCGHVAWRESRATGYTRCGECDRRKARRWQERQRKARS